jgi:hypothetical protein
MYAYYTAKSRLQIMLDRDIRALDQQTSRYPLDRLEARIWAEVEARAQSSQRLAIVVSCQAAVLAVGVLGSIAAGQHFAASSPTTDPLGALGSQTDLAPSHRLIGQ